MWLGATDYPPFGVFERQACFSSVPYGRRGSARPNWGECTYGGNAKGRRLMPLRIFRFSQRALLGCLCNYFVSSFPPPPPFFCFSRTGTVYTVWTVVLKASWKRTCIDNAGAATTCPGGGRGASKKLASGNDHTNHNPTCIGHVRRQGKPNCSD